MTPVQDYLHEINRIRRTGAGTSERSYYAALHVLLNELGRGLKPKVFCLQELAADGAGHADYGLFTAGRVTMAEEGTPLPGTLPDRGVIEAKPPGDDIRRTADSDQVVRYWERYRLVLVTSFHDFLIVGSDQFGRRLHLERFTLADSAEAFFAMAARPGRLDAALDLRLTEFLTRVLLHNAPLARPRDVAWFLASYARDTLARLESAPPGRPDHLDGLGMVRKSLEGALGIRFEGPDGEHFFRSTLVQTLYYGLFSAWVLWARKEPDPAERKGFSALGAAFAMQLPVLRELFWQVSAPGALGHLGVHEVLEQAAATLRRVDDRAFFKRFREDHAVQYFYEPFLEAFDPALRRQLGVWYTPTEIVDYMVERVDRVLREELAIPDGLADERVVVLDPCCGTGSYLVAVLQRIHKTLCDKAGDDALAAAEVKRAALWRVHGFEIMPAPFVVAHLQLAMLMEHLGDPFADQERVKGPMYEHASVLLANAVTGWDPANDRQDVLPLHDLQVARDQARRLKRDEPILVILGNPPYNGFAGVSPSDEERGLTAFYRRVRRVRPPEGQGLNDLYVRFYRMAERRIAEQTGRGVVCFISNYSWLDGLSYTGLRERFLEVFDRIWIDCLNGDKYKTGKVTPDGKPDPSIFSTEHNREGIQVGTAIGLFVRKEEHEDAPAEVRFRNLWGKTKWQELEQTKETDGIEGYELSDIHEELGLAFLPSQMNQQYFNWPRGLSILSRVHFLG